MCGPAAIPIALMVVSTAMAAAQSASQASAQATLANQENQRNATQADYNAQNQRLQTIQAQSEENLVNNQAYQKLDQQGQQTRAASATAQTAAGEGGVSGLSVDALQREYMARSGEFADQVEQNRANDVNHLQLQMQGFNVAEQSEDNSMSQPLQPSFLDSALSVGGAGVAAYGKYLYNPSRSAVDGPGPLTSGQTQELDMLSPSDI